MENGEDTEWAVQPGKTRMRNGDATTEPRRSKLLAAPQAGDQLVGVEMVGTAEIIEDPERMFELGISVFERHNGVEYTPEMKPFVEQMLHKRVVVKINVDKYVSWDHRKLGLPAMQPQGD